jgi:hypothetical protein
MKRIVSSLFIANVLVSSTLVCREIDFPTAQDRRVSSPRIHLDGITTLIHGPERSHIICKSDQKRRGIDSRPRDLAGLIGDELIYQDALKMRIPIDDAVVKDHLRRTLQMFNLKPGQEELIFAQEGYTYEEGFEQFRVMYAVNGMIEHRVKSNVLITEDDVLTYYNANPIVKEPAYLVHTALLPVQKTKGIKREQLELSIDRYIQTGQGLDITWSDPYWLKESEIAQELQFITGMELGQVRKYSIANGFQLYKVSTKKIERTVPLNKRYKHIVDVLRKPKYEERLAFYKKNLLDQATIIYL